MNLLYITSVSFPACCTFPCGWKQKKTVCKYNLENELKSKRHQQQQIRFKNETVLICYVAVSADTGKLRPPRLLLLRSDSKHTWVRKHRSFIGNTWRPAALKTLNLLLARVSLIIQSWLLWKIYLHEGLKWRLYRPWQTASVVTATHSPLH